MSREEVPPPQGWAGWYFPGGREPAAPKSNGADEPPLPFTPPVAEAPPLPLAPPLPTGGGELVPPVQPAPRSKTSAKVERIMPRIAE